MTCFSLTTELKQPPLIAKSCNSQWLVIVSSVIDHSFIRSLVPITLQYKPANFFSIPACCCYCCCCWLPPSSFHLVCPAVLLRQVNMKQHSFPYDMISTHICNDSFGLLFGDTHSRRRRIRDHRSIKITNVNENYHCEWWLWHGN